MASCMHETQAKFISRGSYLACSSRGCNYQSCLSYGARIAPQGMKVSYTQAIDTSWKFPIALVSFKEINLWENKAAKIKSLPDGHIIEAM